MMDDPLQQITATLPQTDISRIAVCLAYRENDSYVRRHPAMHQIDAQALGESYKARAATDPELAKRIAQLLLERESKSGTGEIMDCTRWPDSPVAPPSAAKQIVSAVKAAGRWAKSGLALTPPEELERRKATCAGCEFWDAEAFGGTGRCVKCGCSTWAKLQMASESCPIGKWGGGLGVGRRSRHNFAQPGDGDNLVARKRSRFPVSAKCV